MQKSSRAIVSLTFLDTLRCPLSLNSGPQRASETRSYLYTQFLGSITLWSCVIWDRIHTRQTCCHYCPAQDAMRKRPLKPRSLSLEKVPRSSKIGYGPYPIRHYCFAFFPPGYEMSLVASSYCLIFIRRQAQLSSRTTTDICKTVIL